jgi:ABC-type transport system involved in multi-copper enzyme maturation permease subunit
LLRSAYATIILFVLWVSYSSMLGYQQAVRRGGPIPISALAETAAYFFIAFTWVQLIGILAMAPVMAVGTIATERERRTIDYLFATDLSNFEIVVGKTFARLAIVGQLVLVSLPILFIFRLLGGIPADLLAASFLIAGSTALLLTSLSVCISVWSPRARDAVMRVYRVLAVVIIVPLILWPLLVMIQMQNLGGTWWGDAFSRGLDFCWSVNPIAVLGMAFSGGAAAGAGFDFAPVLRMAAWHLAFSIGLVAMATAAVRRVHLRDSSRGAGGAKSDPAGLRWYERYRWRPRLGDDAMLWKEAFAPTAKTRLGFLGVAANAVVVVIALGLTAYFFFAAALETYGMRDENFFFFAAIETVVLGVCFMLLLAARAAGLVTIEKERDCWLSLLSTPLTGAEIMRAKMLGNLYAARWGYLLLLVTWLLAACFDARYLLLIPLLTGSFLMCTLFVTNVGLQYSLGSETSLRAMGATLATVLFVGGGYFFCGCFCLASASGRPEDVLYLGFAPLLPYLVGAPAILFATGMRDAEASQFAIAFGLGMFGYAVANALLAVDLCNRFDARTGRTTDAPPGTPLERMGAQPA